MDNELQDKNEDRRAYVAPEIEESAPFEQLRLGCTHDPGQSAQCDNIQPNLS